VKPKNTVKIQSLGLPKNNMKCGIVTDKTISAVLLVTSWRHFRYQPTHFLCENKSSLTESYHPIGSGITNRISSIVLQRFCSYSKGTVDIDDFQIKKLNFIAIIK
jgi:hypothetical protein